MLNAIIYCVAVWTANYTATIFIPFPIFGVVSVGTLIFGITFTQRDRVHHKGRKFVYSMIFVAAIGMIIESIFLQVPARILLASFVAIVLSESADTEVYQRVIERRWLFRVVASNAISIPLDSLIFNLVAFLFVFQPVMLAQIIFGEIFFKTLSGALAGLWRRQPLSIAPEKTRVLTVSQ